MWRYTAKSTLDNVVVYDACSGSRGGAAKYVTPEPVHIKLDQLHLAVGLLGQNAVGGDQFHGVPSQAAHQRAADHSAVPDNEGRPASGSTRIFGSYGAQTY
jgi:hypothetical protein